MTLYLRDHRLCVTCAHWRGVREDVRIAPDYLFSVSSCAGECMGREHVQESLPGQSCPRWLHWFEEDLPGLSPQASAA